eukprot:scaffold2162_cov398-Prasinococcus_capsulatus_cf.AAC.12
MLPSSMGKRDPGDYICHLWFLEHCIIGSATGDLFVVENGGIKAVLSAAEDSQHPIQDLVAYAKGKAQEPCHSVKPYGVIRSL